jgi:hypothetical protein
VKLFVDSSVALAACAEASGASRAIFNWAQFNGWELLTSRYVLSEIGANLPRFKPEAQRDWPGLATRLSTVRDLVSFDRPVVLGAAKDRPVLFTAAGWADVLLTLDRRHFGPLFQTGFYGLRVLPPGDFLFHERSAGRLRTN